MRLICMAGRGKTEERLQISSGVEVEQLGWVCARWVWGEFFRWSVWTQTSGVWSF